MEKTISAIEASRDLEEILDSVARGDRFRIEFRGKPAAVIVPVEVYEQLERLDKKASFNRLQEISERVDMSEEEAEELIEEVKQAVRSRQRVVEKMKEMASQADMSEEDADALAAEAVAWARANKDK